MRGRLKSIALFASLFLLPASLAGQKGGEVGGNVTPSLGSESWMAGKVVTPDGDPVSHALIKLQNFEGAQNRIFQTDSEGGFRVEYTTFLSIEVRDLLVTVQVTKKGFRDAHKLVEIQESGKIPDIVITLRPAEEDSSLLSQADLIAGLAPRLRQLSLADGLPANLQKDYARGGQSFLDRGHPDWAIPNFIKVAARAPSCLKCRTMLALAELSWGDWDDAKGHLEGTVNALIADKKLACPEPLVAYGVLVSWGHQPAKASPYFQEAIKYAPQDALALQELGRAQCLDLDWAAANDTLSKALAAGAGPEARFMHAEALLWAGTPGEADAELNRYLDGRDVKKMPPQVRTVWERLQERKRNEAAFNLANAKALAKGEQLLDYIHHPPRNLPEFEPASDQSQLAAILESVGKNVSDLFANLPNTCSVEKVHQEKVSRKGKQSLAQDSTYRYLALMPLNPWGPYINEYRSDSQGNLNTQKEPSGDYMLTSGFISGSLIFHPAYQNGSTFRLLGRQKLHGRDTYLIAYAQDPGKARIYGGFNYGKSITRTYTQGLVWVDSKNFQIVRLTSDLLTPLPQIRLEKETTDIEFSEVNFNQVAKRFWLPGHVTVTIDWNGRILRNQHDYSDFLAFNVESSQKIGKLKDTGKTPDATPPPTAQ